MAQKMHSEIDLLLPHKERFCEQNAGAVSTVVHELARHMTNDNTQFITIFGSPVPDPKQGVVYQGLSPRHFLWQSRNYGMGKAYLMHLKATARTPAIVEVHGRPQVALQIARARPDLRVTLYLHNDPRTMKGAKSLSERRALSHHLAAIISITDYVKSCFLDGLGDASAYHARHFVNHLGVERQISAPQERQKQLCLAGRMVPEKGMLEACLGAVRVLRDHPEWRLCLAGGQRFTNDKLSAYEAKIKQAIAPLGDQAVMFGHMPLADVRTLQQRSEICLVPSLWQEPGGLTVLEALAAGAALITTNRGGIPEFANGRAILLDDTSPQDFESAIRALVEQPTKRAALQKKAWDDYPFHASEMAHRAARFRLSLLP